MGNLPSSVASAPASVRQAARRPVDPDLDLVEGVVAQLDLVVDGGARKRINEGLSDFRRMYLGTYTAGSRVSVFELYDCMQAVSDGFMQLQYDCGWGADARQTITRARTLAVTRMQACVDEAAERTGMVNPRAFVSDTAAHTRYMEQVRSWPPSADGPAAGDVTPGGA